MCKSFDVLSVKLSKSNIISNTCQICGIVCMASNVITINIISNISIFSLVYIE